jgi:hypothetical protein
VGSSLLVIQLLIGITLTSSFGDLCCCITAKEGLVGLAVSRTFVLSFLWSEVPQQHLVFPVDTANPVSLHGCTKEPIPEPSALTTTIILASVL